MQAGPELFGVLPQGVIHDGTLIICDDLRLKAGVQQHGYEVDRPDATLVELAVHDRAEWIELGHLIGRWISSQPESEVAKAVADDASAVCLDALEHMRMVPDDEVSACNDG